MTPVDTDPPQALRPLFEPISIGRRTARNRIVLPPNGANQTGDGLYNAGVVGYYAEVAARTAGMIVTGASVVHPSSAMPRLQRIYDPANQPWLRTLADEVHRSKTLLVCQLMHLGSHMRPVLGEPAWMPSSVASEWQPDFVRGMDLSEIGELRAAFIDAARLIVNAGWDGVELHATHSYLLHQFLSPRTNRRTDSYGGRSENRRRLLIEILEAWRSLDPAPAIVGMRISAGELTSDGLQWDEVLDLCGQFSAAGLVDYVSLTIPTPDEYVKDAAYPVAGLASMSSELRERVRVPVIVSQRITSPAVAARVVADGAADLVAIGRGLVADPAWGEKAATGRAHLIRPCTACMEDCRAEGPYSGSRRTDAGGYGCILNPTPYQASKPRVALPAEFRAVVVGAGPAGVEAALGIANAGASVVLLERDGRVGGRTRTAGRAPHRSEWTSYADYLEAAVEEHPRIELVLDCEATPAVISAHRPDAVVVAAGTRPTDPPPSLGELAIHVEHLLARGVLAKGHWLVVDELGRWESMNAVELLLAEGCDVHLAIRGEQVGARVPSESRADLLSRLRNGGVSVTRFARDVLVDGRYGQITDRLGYVTTVSELVGVAWGGPVQSVSLHDGWEVALGVPVVAVGDGLSPRGLSMATKEGAAVAGRLASLVLRAQT